MATRFYLNRLAPAPVNPNYGSLWELAQGDAPLARGLMRTSLWGTSLSSATVFRNSSTSGVDILTKQWVSDPVAATTIDGTFTWVVMCSESLASINGILQCRIAVVSNDGTTERGELYSGQTAASASATSTDPNYEVGTALQTRVLSGSVTPVDALDGDRIVFEIGHRCFTSTVNANVSYRIGDPTSGSDYAGTVGETSTTARPWLELSEDLSFVGSTLDLRQASGTDLSRTLTRVRRFTATPGVATETSEATPLAFAAVIPVGQASEVSSATALSYAVTAEIGRATESETAAAIGLATTDPGVAELARAAESDSARALTAVLGNTIPLGRAAETDAARAMTEPPLVMAVGRAVSTEAARGVFAINPTLRGEVKTQVRQDTGRRAFF